MRALLAPILSFGLFACSALPPSEPAPPPPRPVVLAPAPAPVAEPVADAGAPAEVVAAAPSATPEEVPALIEDTPLPKDQKWSDELRLRQGVTTVTGRLPPEVVQRIVRQSFGRVRLCVEHAKARGSTRMTTTFTIDRSGAVTPGASAQTEPEDVKLSDCVGRVFATLSFPQPEGGTVAVTYPIVATREAVSKTAPKKKPSKKGGMWGDSIGESFGQGGLGLSGVGEGGGGRGEGIGLGTPKK